MLADLVVIPSQPHFLDLDAVMRITNFLDQIRTIRPNRQPRASIFLNRCVARTLLSEESDDFLDKFCHQHDLIYFQTRLHQRQAVADSPNQKNFVLNENLSKAKAEFEELCIEILGVIKIIWLEKDSPLTII
jgi:chromosome partitioning protein